MPTIRAASSAEKAWAIWVARLVVKVGVLVVDGIVGALHQAGLLEALEEALPAVVQGAVAAVLVDADDGHLAAGGVPAPFTAAGGQGQDHGQGKGSAEQFFQGFHVTVLLLI